LDRVLKARYGEEGGRLKEGGRHSSNWWRMLCGVHSRMLCKTNPLFKQVFFLLLFLPFGFLFHQYNMNKQFPSVAQ